MKMRVWIPEGRRCKVAFQPFGCTFLHKEADGNYYCGFFGVKLDGLKKEAQCIETFGEKGGNYNIGGSGGIAKNARNETGSGGKFLELVNLNGE
jgi:hypothetical protein